MNIEIQPYLTFNGNCEEAFNFYKSVFGGEFSRFKRFNDMPPQEGMPIVTEVYAKRIMYVALPITPQFTLCGADIGFELAPNHVADNITLLVKVKDKQEADNLFKSLSMEGKITLPLSDTFWGAHYGMCTDKFGINWMINMSIEPKL